MSELKPCSVPDCVKPKKKGDGKYCSMHRARLARTGRLDKKSTIERLAEKSELNLETGCVEWTGYLNHCGYGRLRVGGKKMLAHRAAYEEANGPIPEGLIVCHKCDNPKCINVDHLFLGTDKDNHKDAVTKGRINPVERAKDRWKKCPTLKK